MLLAAHLFELQIALPLIVIAAACAQAWLGGQSLALAATDYRHLRALASAVARQWYAMVLAAGLTLSLGWLTWQVRRELNPAPKEPVIRAYSRLCAKLAAAGMPRLAHEGAEDYAARVAQRRPDLGPAVIALCRHYSILRYAAAPARITVGQFEAAVRAFRPRACP